MPRDLPVTSEKFEQLLEWIGPNPAEAALRYENIRTRLIRLFSCRGCFDAEDLADETFNRVTRKIEDLRGSIDSGPIAYFYGVASNIHLEWLRERRRFSEMPAEVLRTDVDQPDSEAEDRHHDCLEECLGRLSSDGRMVILAYYRGERSEKIANRKKLADGLKMSANALQVKVLRIRAQLKVCIEGCLR